MIRGLCIDIYIVVLLVFFKKLIILLCKDVKMYISNKCCSYEYSIHGRTLKKY